MSCRTVTKTSFPLRPCFSVIDSIVDTRRISVPSTSGRRKMTRPPAHIRRGSGTGGRKPPRLGWPSTPVCRSEERRVGKSVSVRVDLGGRRLIKKKKKYYNQTPTHI